MKAEVIFTGTELLLGQILNTNAQYLQQALASIGVDLYYQVTVGDNLTRTMEAIQQARARADLIIIGGGLGPTEDDLSKEALAAALKLQLKENSGALKIVERFFKQNGLKMSSNNLKQALVPEGAHAIDNPVGTAPGIVLEHNQKIYVLLPGPPGEFKKMLEKEVIPFLRKRIGENLMVIRSKVLKLAGIGEAALDEKLGELLHSSNPSVAPTAKLSKVHLRITAKAQSDTLADQMIENIEGKIRKKLNDFIYGVNEDTLAKAVIKQLQKKNYRLSLVEVFTGGYINHLLTNIPECKNYLNLCISTSNIKRLADFLYISPELFEQDNYTEIAAALAAGIKNYTQANIGLAITSLQQEGVVFIGTAIKDSSVKKIQLWGSAQEMKERAAATSLSALWRMLK